MADDPFALFDHGSPRRALASPTIPKRWRWPLPTPTGRRRCEWCCSRATGPTGSSSTPTTRAARARSCCQSACRFAIPLEVAAATGPGRRAGRAASPRTKPMLISPPAAAIPGSAPGRPTSRGRSTSRETFEQRFEESRRRFEGKDVPRPPHLGGLPRRSRADRVLERPAASAARTAAVHPRRRRLDRRAALPMTSADDRGRTSRALDARGVGQRRVAVILLVAKAWAAYATGSTAMLGSLADTALDVIASLTTLAGGAHRGRPRRPRSPLRARQGGGAGRRLPRSP